jgi:hypothetical protein
MQPLRFRWLVGREFQEEWFYSPDKYAARKTFTTKRNTEEFQIDNFRSEI